MYLLVQLQVSELMLKDILALMSLGVKLNFKKKMPQVTLYSHYVSCGADISVIIDIFTQEGSKCMKNRQFNSQIAHFLWAHSLFTFPFPNFLLQTTGGETYFLVLFFLLCASLSDFISHEWISHSPYLSISLSA